MGENVCNGVVGYYSVARKRTVRRELAVKKVHLLLSLKFCEQLGGPYVPIIVS